MIGVIGPEEYDELCRRLEAVLQDATEAEATIAVASKGDPRLVEIEGREGRHFPGDPEGRYAGYYPRTSEEAISQLEEARRSGAEFFCLPATGLWWLDHYQGLAGWLATHCHVVVDDPETCVLYDLGRIPARGGEEEPGSGAQIRALLDSLLPEDAVVYAIGFAGEGLSTSARSVDSIEASGLFALRRRLEGGAEQPTFLVLAHGDSPAGADPGLERSLATWTAKVAQRKDLCDIFQVTAGPSRSRLSRSPREGDPAPGSTSQALGGEAAEKLTNRLQRLGLPGPDAGAVRANETSP
jgi:hypothetical protein